jgi:hypothetical protein
MNDMAALNIFYRRSNNPIHHVRKELMLDTGCRVTKKAFGLAEYPESGITCHRALTYIP